MNNHCTELIVFLQLPLVQLCVLLLRFKVKVKLRLTVSQSVCLGVKFNLELVTRYYFLYEGCCVVSVTRGRVCLLSVTVICV
jgi:hypothetical protein